MNYLANPLRLVINHILKDKPGVYAPQKPWPVAWDISGTIYKLKNDGAFTCEIADELDSLVEEFVKVGEGELSRWCANNDKKAILKTLQKLLALIQ